MLLVLQALACVVTRRTQSPPVRLVTEAESIRSACYPVGSSGLYIWLSGRGVLLVIGVSDMSSVDGYDTAT